MKMEVEIDSVRGMMAVCGVDGARMAVELGITPQTVSRLLNGEAEWRLGQIWKVMKLLRIPNEAMAQFFPEPKKKKGVKRA